MNTFQDLLNNLLPEPNSGCWLWMGSVNKNGYVQMRIGGVRKYIHVFIYEYYKGPVPEGKEIDHTCNLRCCGNPDHLELVTHWENNDRIFQRGIKKRNPRPIPKTRRETRFIIDDNTRDLIVQDYKTLPLSTEQLAFKYSIGRSSVARIVRGG